MAKEKRKSEKAVKGKKTISIEERFVSLHEIYSPEFFIVTFLEELEGQEGLKDFLYENFPVYIQEKDYLIFDVRKNIEE